MANIDCVCPPKADGEPRHPDGDTVTLRERLDFPAATAINYALRQAREEDPDVDGATMLAVMSEKYLLFGIESWSIVDEKGKPLEVTKPNIRSVLLTRDLVALAPIVNEADVIYQPQVLAPLVAAAQKSSSSTPTEPLTSPPTDSPVPLQKRSKRSSTSTIPTADTEMTSQSPDGGSSSSPNSVSAA